MGNFAADGTKQVLGKGAVLFNRFLPGTSAGKGLRFLGNVTELTLSTTDEKVDRYSSVEDNSPLTASVAIRRTVEAVLTMDEFTKDNLALALMGDTINTAQTSATAATVSFANVQKGLTYKIPAFMVSNVVVKVAAATMVLGTDYSLEAQSGLLTVLTAGAIVNDDDLDVTYDRAAITGGIDKVRGGVSGKIEGELMFRSDNANGPNYILRAWRASAEPEGDTGFISEDFGEFQVRFKLQDDSTNHAGEGLYTIETFTGIGVS